jgi:hypothetical protein
MQDQELGPSMWIPWALNKNFVFSEIGHSQHPPPLEASKEPRYDPETRIKPLEVGNGADTPSETWGGGTIFFKSSNNEFVDLYLIFISETCCFTIQHRGFRYIMFPLFRHTKSGKAWNADLNLEKAFPPYCTMILKPYFSIFDRTWTAHCLIDRGIAAF